MVEGLTLSILIFLNLKLKPDSRPCAKGGGPLVVEGLTLSIRILFNLEFKPED